MPMITSSCWWGGRIAIAIVLSAVMVRAAEVPATRNAATDVERHVADAQAAEAKQDYPSAAKSYAAALALEPNNASLWTGYGDVLNQLSSQDVEFMRRARAAWDQALVVDPTFKPALDRMMRFWSDVANIDASRPEVFTQLRATALKILETDPNDEAAAVAMPSSIIRPWLAGGEQKEEEIAAAVEKLLALGQKFAGNADIPMFAAQAKLRLSERERQQGRAKESQQLANEASRIIEAALQRTPSAAMYFSAAQVAQVQETLGGNQGAEFREKKQDYYVKAQQLVKPDDPLFVHIHIAAARGAERPEAERILRELIKQRPEDQQVRLALAEQLAMDRDKRHEALEILDRPFADGNLIGPKAYLVRELQIRTLVTATNLRLDDYASADKDGRARLLPVIEQNMSLLTQRDADSARVLRLRGKLLRLQGETVKAIQTLEKARQIAEKTGAATQADTLDRWEVIDLLAKAYIETNQTGRAKQLLTELVNRFPGYEPARLLLASVLVKEGSIEEARPHVKYLSERKPNDPEVIKLVLQTMDPKGVDQKGADAAEQKTQIKATYARLPEKTTQQMLDKVNAAMVVDQKEDAVRLLEKLRQAAPGDYETACMAVRVFRYLGELQKARDYVDAAVAANPTNEKLQVLKKQVQDLTPEGLIKVTLAEAEKNPDPVARAMIKANCYRRLNRMDEALNELQIAQQIRPQDTEITALIFAHYLQTKQWDKAGALIEPLAASNQDQAGGILFRYRLAMAKADYAAALELANQLTKRMPEFGQSWLALGQAQQGNRQFEEALNSYLAALERQRDNPDAFRGAIECNYALNRPADAERILADARRALPTNETIKELEIQHQLSYGDATKALAAREEAYRRDKNKAANVIALGQAYLAVARAKGQPANAEFFTKAKEVFRSGIELFPDEIAFYAYYAEVCARSGTFDDAEKMLNQLAAREAWKNRPEPKQLQAELAKFKRNPTTSPAQAPKSN